MINSKVLVRFYKALNSPLNISSVLILNKLFREPEKKAASEERCASHKRE